MTENYDDLSRLVEIDARSSVNMNDECLEIIGNVQINPNRFRMLCDNVENCFLEIDNSIFELIELKDKLLLQYLPRNLLLQITLILSRFYRAYSQSQIPFYELIRLVHLYSEPFDIKCTVLKRLYDSNELRKRMLNLAVQRLASMENNAKRHQEEQCINNWEKMYIRLALPRSNIRKWKFRIKTFREKAELGYEHVMEWIDTRIAGPSLVSDASIDDRLETSVEIVNIQEKNELKLQIDHGSNHDNEIGSAEKENSQPIVTKNDIEIQVQPDFDHQETSTEDILSTKSLIMRIYRPIGIAKTNFQCIVHAQERQYTTKVFTFNVFPQKSNVQLTVGSRISRTKKPTEISTTPDINTIDKEQIDEFLIPMPNALKRRSLFQTDIDPDALKIEIFGDKKLCGSLILSSEDLKMLDLLILHSRTFSPLIALDDNPTTNGQLDFDQSSNELYKSWISRTPPTFSIYNNKNEPIGKLPLLMFWYNKLENTHATKSTMTMPMEIRVPTPKVEIVVSPIAEKISDENIEPNSSDDQIEMMKKNYENEITKLHENYQAEIHRLTDILNQRSSKLDETTQQNLSNTKTQRQTKRPIVMERPSSLVSGKDLPKNFLDRYQMYLQRSIMHRHQLITKVEHETALANERQMAIQHRLYKSDQNNEYNDDLCLPAVFMPFRSGNVINPRAYRFFHSVGSAAPRLTQAPSIVKFPSLPPRSISVLNLFELSRRYGNSNERDRSTTQTVHSTMRPTTETSD